MRDHQFDRLTRGVEHRFPRRDLPALLMPALGAFGMLGTSCSDASARKKSPRKKRPACRAGLTPCKVKKGKKKKTVCVDVQTDPAHCGRCGNRCSARQDCSAGVCSTCSITVSPGDDVQQAIDATPVGGRLCLTAGIFQISHELVVDSDLSIVGMGESTVLQGSGDSRIFRVEPSVTASLSDMHIAGGRAENGGGIRNYGDLTLERCEIRDCQATHPGSSGYGGGILSADSTDPGRVRLTMRNCTITGNKASNYFGGGLASLGRGGVTLTECRFDQNEAYGGAAIFLDGPAKLDTCTIVNNSGIDGTIYALDKLSLIDCLIADNTAEEAGGGLYAYFACGELQRVSLLNTVIRDNRATTGGAIFADASELHLQASIIKGNRAVGDEFNSVGGGIAAMRDQNFSGHWCGSLVLDDSSISENVADADGGGIWSFNPSGEKNITFLNGSSVTANTPNNCGGVAIAGCTND